MTTKPETTDRKTPDKSKEAKLARMLDAITATASAYFNAGGKENEDLALFLRGKQREIGEKFADK